MSCVLALSACMTAAPQRTPAPRHPAASPEIAPLSFPRLEGVYRQPGRSFVVTHQGWWLDLESEQIRQLSPVTGGSFSYGPGWQDPVPVQGQLRFSTDAGIPVRVTGIAPGGVPVDAVRLPVPERNVRFPSQGAVLAGTLSIPPGPGPHPGIVILQGSGALDRHFESISGRQSRPDRDQRRPGPRADRRHPVRAGLLRRAPGLGGRAHHVPQVTGLSRR